MSSIRAGRFAVVVLCCLVMLGCGGRETGTDKAGIESPHREREGDYRPLRRDTEQGLRAVVSRYLPGR